MKKLVDTCVSEVIELIKDQIGKIGVDKNRRTKVRAPVKVGHTLLMAV